MLYTIHPSPLGELLIAGPRPGTLASVTVPGQKGGARVGPDWWRDPAAFAAVTREFDAYFAGEPAAFAAAELVPVGTPFRQRVWAALDGIPYGSTVTYGELAARAGLSPRAVRAVGGAVGANPLTVIRPCHRVIGAGGSLTGYAGGLDRKRQLLTLEGALADQGAVPVPAKATYGRTSRSRRLPGLRPGSTTHPGPRFGGEPRPGFLLPSLAHEGQRGPGGAPPPATRPVEVPGRTPGERRGPRLERPDRAWRTHEDLEVTPALHPFMPIDICRQAGVSRAVRARFSRVL
jgi:methylated-DNA-[protein]-cysteine S-methyltransferase